MLPPKVNRLPTVSQISSIKISSKAEIDDYQDDIERIIGTNSKNKKLKVQKVLISLNDALLLEIND
jgi:hypothetical protein